MSPLTTGARAPLYVKSPANLGAKLILIRNKEYKLVSRKL